MNESLQLALDGGESGLVHDLRADSSLRVLVTNVSSSDGTVHLTGTSISGAGRRQSALTELRVQAGETVAVSLPVRNLDLADGPFDFSGTLSISGALAYEGGRSDDVLLNLFFHPTVAGWQINDAAAWAATFDRGVLTERARAARAEANAIAAALSERDGIPTSVVAVESFEVPGDER